MDEEELEEWSECDLCHANEAQIENSRVLAETVSIRRRTFIRKREHIETVHERMVSESILHCRRLCFRCSIKQHGTASLGALEIYGWVDTPCEHTRPDSPPEAVADWEKTQQEQRDYLDKRELDYLLRDQDIFDGAGKPHE